MLPSRVTGSFVGNIFNCNKNMLRSFFVCQNVLLQSEKSDEGLKQNPYYEKYADKIKSVKAEVKANESGNQTNRMKNREKRLRRETEEWKQNIAMVEQKLNEKKQTEDSRRGSRLPTKLDELIRMDLLETKSTDEVSHIWMEHFKEKECVSAVIPVHIFDDMTKQIEEFPIFLYPLPKSQGYEFVLSQFDRSRCFFTSLLNFQVHGDNAPWQLCMTFYEELKASKGVVLMTSELDASTLNIMKAQCLAQLQKLFYVQPTEDRLALLHNFNKTPDSFKYMDLVKEVEKSNMVVKDLP